MKCQTALRSRSLWAPLGHSSTPPPPVWSVLCNPYWGDYCVASISTASELNLPKMFCRHATTTTQPWFGCLPLSLTLFMRQKLEPQVLLLFPGYAVSGAAARQRCPKWSKVVLVSKYSSFEGAFLSETVNVIRAAGTVSADDLKRSQWWIPRTFLGLSLLFHSPILFWVTRYASVQINSHFKKNNFLRVFCRKIHRPRLFSFFFTRGRDYESSFCCSTPEGANYLGGLYVRVFTFDPFFCGIKEPATET